MVQPFSAGFQLDAFGLRAVFERGSVSAGQRPLPACARNLSGLTIAPGQDRTEHDESKGNCAEDNDVRNWHGSLRFDRHDDS